MSYSVSFGLTFPIWLHPGTFSSLERCRILASRPRRLQLSTISPTFRDRRAAFLFGAEVDKAIRAFRHADARQPSDREVQILKDLRAGSQAWFPVAQALMNLDETISKP